MGSKSKTHEKSTTTGQSTTTPTYQEYATPIVQGLSPQMQQAYQTSMAGYGEPGYNPYQQALWSQVGQQALGQYGLTGPAAQVAQQAIQPYLGQGYMQTLEPYYQTQQQYIEQAMPQQEKQFMQQLKKQFGPAWGTHGQALAGAADSYTNFKAQQAAQLADLYGQKGQAAQAGMQYGAQVAPTYAQMVNPFAWGQQAINWAGQPEQATTEAMQQQQALATGWATPLTQLATLGYTFPQATTEAGTQTTRGTSNTAQGGMSCCFIMNEAGDLTDTVRWARDVRYGKGSKVAEGYKRMAKWLVPMMQKSSLIKSVVRCTMTWPIRKVAEKRIVGRHHPALYPIGFFWEAVWGLYGRI